MGPSSVGLESLKKRGNLNIEAHVHIEGKCYVNMKERGLKQTLPASP